TWQRCLEASPPKLLVKTARRGVQEAGPPYDTMRLPWSMVSMNLLADELGDALASQLYQIHSAFKALVEIESLSAGGAPVPVSNLLGRLVSYLKTSSKDGNPDDQADAEKALRAKLTKRVPTDLSKIARGLLAPGASTDELAAMAKYLTARFAFHVETIVRAS